MPSVYAPDFAIGLCPLQTTRLISLLACESEPIARPDVRRFVSFFPPSRFIRQFLTKNV